MVKSKISIVFLLLGGCSLSEAPSCEDAEVVKILTSESFNNQELWNSIKMNGLGERNPKNNDFLNNENINNLRKLLEKTMYEKSEISKICGEYIKKGNIIEHSADHYSCLAITIPIVQPIMKKIEELEKKIESEKINYYNSEFLKYASSSKYYLTNIVILKKDNEMKSSICRANLNLNIEGWGQDSLVIKYSVFQTVDGKVITERNYN